MCVLQQLRMGSTKLSHLANSCIQDDRFRPEWVHRTVGAPVGGECNLSFPRPGKSPPFLYLVFTRYPLKVHIKLPEDSVAFFEKIVVMMGDVEGKITLEQYKQCVKKHPLFFQSLGLIYDNETEFINAAQLNMKKGKRGFHANQAY